MVTKVSSIAVELNSSRGIFSSIAIELKIDGQRALRQHATYTHYARQYMSNGMIHSANSHVRLTSSDWLKVGFLIQGRVAADTSHSGTIFDQSDARRQPVSR